MKILILLCVILTGTMDTGLRLEADPFLRPYIAKLKKETPSSTLKEIVAMSKDRLGLLHFGYGMWIRNKWLWGNRNPKLVQFFLDHGVNHPDEMSSVLIHALWEDLNQSLTPEERAGIEAKRKLVSAKEAAYIRLRQECSEKILASKDRIAACLAANGRPSKKNPNQDPFFKMTLKNDGTVGDIEFLKNDSEELKQCLRPILDGYKFSSFDNDDQLTLHITKFPNCAVSEFNELH